MVVYHFHLNILKDGCNEEISCIEIGKSFVDCLDILNFRMRVFFGYTNYHITRLEQITDYEND